MGAENMEERMNVAILQACRALRRRHRLEEGAHGPALAALTRVAQGAEVHGKVESLQEELHQSYRAHAQAREELVTQLTASQNFYTQLTEKESRIAEDQQELASLRTRVEELQKRTELQDHALEATENERQSLQGRIQELEKQLFDAKVDNKELLDRWMSQKMHDAERLNEANAMYEDMMERLKGSRLEELAKQQVDGIVRQSEAGAELYVDSRAPTQLRQSMHAHESGGTVIAFEHNSPILYSGGHDGVVRKWDTLGGNSLGVLRGCLGLVHDLCVSVANRYVLAGCSDHKLYFWDASNSRLKHTLTGHTEKVVGVDLSQVGSSRAVSASHDRTMKVWDMETGYATNTVLCFSNCNAICFTSDGSLMCSGHMDGHLRFWDIRSGKQVNEMAAHSQSITSVTLSRGGHMILTSGRDNVHNLLDVRALDVLDRFRSSCYRASTNWTRSCLSPNETYVAAGSADGTVVVWSRKSGENETLLKTGHASAVVSCVWSDEGKPMASGDKSGKICLWT